ncbi:MAG: NAD(P)-dependent oxidoreductase [Clostridiaceae bacterium]|jgi:dTDP-4-dehydrorhamnose reductase|nr:NAD(P)-dependent oxidoreductase [Clostridiaceae bacterium]
MKKLLFTGGKGFVCTRLAEYYGDKYEIISTDKDDLDITDYDKVLAAFQQYKPDYVLHAAAIAVTDFCNQHPELAHKINVEGAVNVAKACKSVGAKMIFISSEQIFNGNSERGPYDEEHKAVPDTVYGQNKLEAEGLLKNILHELWIIRFTWMFGLPKEGCGMASNIMWGTVSSILKNEKIKAPVNEYRGMTYIVEMIENFHKIFDLPYGTYNFGSGNDLSRYHVVKLIIEELGLGHKLQDLLEADTEKYKDNPRDIRLVTDKITKNGIVFSTTEEAIKRCVKDEIKGDIGKYRASMK